MQLSIDGCPMQTDEPIAVAGSAAILAFARLPVPGKVKTRLAAGIGAQDAAALYGLLLRAVLQQASRHGADAIQCQLMGQS